MFYGDEVILSHDTVRISPKAIQPIGIVHGSRCWGIWLRDVRDSHQGRPPHLLLSSFYPNDWPALFRITLKIQDRPGKAERVAEILSNIGFNILFTESVPSGHRHLTCNVIGVAQELKGKIEGLEIPPIPADRDVSEQPEILDFVSKTFSPIMLEYALNLERRLLDENERLRSSVKSGFLHDRFVQQQTLLYDIERLPEMLRRRADCQLLRPVRCSWLQNFAAFWLFGENKERPIAFRFEGEKEQIVPDEHNRQDYREVVRRWIPDPPTVGVASFAHEEHYVRIAIPDAKDQRVRIRIPYSVLQNDSKDATSKGLLYRVMSILNAQGLNIDHVANATTELTPAYESGAIFLICSSPERIRMERLQMQLGEQIHPYAQVKDSRVEVNKLGAKILFLSTRIEWVNQKVELIPALTRLAERYGFRLRHCCDVGGKVVESTVVSRIQQSDAFLQIVPTYDQWVNFELGVARGCGIPDAVCLDRRVDEADVTVMRGRGRYTFSSDMDTNQIVEAVQGAVNWLQTEAAKQ